MRKLTLKIKEIRVIVTCPHLNYIIVKILTDQDGLYGVGDASLAGRGLAVATALEKHIAPLLIGRDSDRIEDIWQYIFRGTYWRGGPVLMSALAGIDMALWDIKGKRAGMPVYSLLGGKCREKVMAYAHARGQDFNQVEDNVRELQEEGFRVIRVQASIPELPGAYGDVLESGRVHQRSQEKLPHEFVWDTGPYLRTIPRLFEHLRNKLGEEVDLFHDVHGKLTPIEACRLAKELEPYHLFFLEDPLRPEHKESFRLLRNHTSIPISMGELFHTKWECLQLITEQLIDFIRIDLTHSGGITEGRKIATLAEPFHIKTAWHGPDDLSPIGHAANVHLDLAVSNFGIQESMSFKPEVHEVISGCPERKNGYLTVSDAPGLGIDINEEAAKKYPFDRFYLPTPRFEDGSVADW